MANEKYYPPPSFHFKVSFTGLNNEDMDSRFQSVSGLNVEVETETRREGGENRFEHTLPVKTKYTPLVLKRGVVVSSALFKWCIASINAIGFGATDKSKPLIEPKNLTVTLLNEKHQPLMTWNVVQAWPRKWALTDLNAEQTALAIETLELQYQYFTIET